MKVKSCPCCGNINYIGIQTKFISNNLMYRVVCNDVNWGRIDASKNGCGLRTGWFLTIREAVEKWNTRIINDNEINIPTSTL